MGQRRDGTEPMIQHGKVYLRPAERDDIPRFVAWLNDWRTGRTLGMRAPLSGPLEERWFDTMLADQGKSHYHFVMCLLDDDRPIGTIGLMHVDLANGNAGVGISVGNPDDRGHGYGTDGLRALLRYGFDHLRLERIWLDVFDIINPGAKRVYERVGFVTEGTFRHAVYHEGRFRDVARMAILAEEWRAAAGEAAAGESAPA